MSGSVAALGKNKGVCGGLQCPAGSRRNVCSGQPRGLARDDRSALLAEPARLHVCDASRPGPLKLSPSILSNPRNPLPHPQIQCPVALVDRNVEESGPVAKEAATAFVNYLYTPEAQRHFAECGFR